jgi:hypothetical protein
MTYFESIPQAFNTLVPHYLSKSWKNQFFSIKSWDNRYGDQVAAINPKRATDRVKAYLNMEEIIRVNHLLYGMGKKEVSIRFGFEKKGKGYHGERGDFCLVGGAIKGRHLTLFYRSLEMIGGFGYDLHLINQLGKQLNIECWKTVTIFATHSQVFALRRNSNEALYPKLLKIMET